MRAAAAESAYEAHTSDPSEPAKRSSPLTDNLFACTAWTDVPSVPKSSRGKRLPNGSRAIEISVSLDGGQPLSSALVASVGSALNRGLAASAGHFALRADSPDAPATHAEAEKLDQEREAAGLGPIWVCPGGAEANEIGNHKKNASWTTITRDQLPEGRRVHKLIWVYKVKRDGRKKSRLCVQGCTQIHGVDYDQSTCTTLRHPSLRVLSASALVSGKDVPASAGPPLSRANRGTRGVVKAQHGKDVFFHRDIAQVGEVGARGEFLRRTLLHLHGERHRPALRDRVWLQRPRRGRGAAVAVAASRFFKVSFAQVDGIL